MAFKGNPFTLLTDDDDGDGDVAPHAPDSEKPAKPNNERSERGRGRGRGGGERGRGSGRNSGTFVERLGHGQKNGVQKNQERESNYYQNNGYRRYNGHSDRYRQHRGRANGYQQQNRGGDGYRKTDVHEQNNVDSTKASIHEQNNADSTKPYLRDSSNNKDDGTEQEQQWHTIGGGRGRRFDEKNGFTSQDQVLGANQQHESKWLEKDSGASQEKLTDGKFYNGEVNPSRNGRSSSSGERKGDRGSNRGNWVARRGNSEVKTSERKETRGGNEVPLGSGEKGKVTADVSKRRERKENGQYSEKGVKTDEEYIITMTLQEYEKQLLETRKTFEALKQEERKVTLDKDLESMQLVGRKKEDVTLVKQNFEKAKLKKDDSLEKDEKLVKDCGAITQAWYRRYRLQRGRGKRDGGSNNSMAATTNENKGGSNSMAATTNEDKAIEIDNSDKTPVQTPYVEDLDQFPGLGDSGGV